MLHGMRMVYVFNDFTDDTGERDWSVVFRLAFISFFENPNDIYSVSLLW